MMTLLRAVLQPRVVHPVVLSTAAAMLSQRGPHPVYAEIVGTTARIIDSATSQVLWRGEFWVADPEPPEDPENNLSECGGWWPWSMDLWWDPTTRYVLSAQTYRTGGSCMCTDEPVETVQHAAQR